MCYCFGDGLGPSKYCSILRLYRDNGKENGNYCSILGLYGDNGKENGNYSGIFITLVTSRDYTVCRTNLCNTEARDACRM